VSNYASNYEFPLGFGAGGAIWASGIAGSIRWNTIVDNDGFPGTSCSGGGIALSNTTGTLDISDNIIVGSEGCGVACQGQPSTAFGRNLLWNNDPTDIGGACPSEWLDAVVLADPLFCDPAMGDHRVAANSPALTGPAPLGAFHEPGCEPVAVESTTWGRVKARYR
jgi:hypothetical protein